MSEFDYSVTAASAARLLARFGQDVTLRRQDAASYNPSSATATPATPADVTRKGAIFSLGAGVTTIRGEMVRATDQIMYLEPGVIPKLSDSVLVNGATYVIVSIDELSPAGVPVLYTLHLRR